MKNTSFKTPSNEYKTVTFWSFNDLLENKELKRQLLLMKAAGWGGGFMHSRVGLVTEYMSDRWLEHCVFCCEQAKKSGMNVWLYDEDKWPSGYGGGIVAQNKKLISMGLVLIKSGEETANDQVLKMISNNGVQYLACVRTLPDGIPWFNKTSYVDLLNPETTKYFLESTHEKYKKYCGTYFGNTIPGIFTDEPCYIHHGFLKAPAVPWTTAFLEYFKEKKGYSIEEKLEALFFETLDYQKVRFDFYDSATRLFIESFTKPYYEWCNKNNIQFTGHFMAEDNLVYQTEWIGAAMPHYEHMHIPGIDKLGRNIKQLSTVKQLTSVSDQLSRRALCEGLGCIGHQSAFFHRKWITDWLIALGVNFINPHLTLYSIRGERKRDYPSNLSWIQPWWDLEDYYSGHTTRLCQELSKGKRSVDVLILHPISSVWAQFSPLHKKTLAASIWAGIPTFARNSCVVENENYQKPFDEISEELLKAGIDFHYGDEIVMESNASVENGEIVIGQNRYKTVIVPHSDNIRHGTSELLDRMVQSAGRNSVIFIENIPERIDGVVKTNNWMKTASFTGNTFEAIKILKSIRKPVVSVVDRMTQKTASSIICNARELADGSRILFIYNGDEEREVSTDIYLNWEKAPFIKDTLSGECFTIPFTIEKDNRKKIQVIFQPAGSLLISCESDIVPSLLSPRFIKSGVQLDGRPLISATCSTNWAVDVTGDNVMVIDKLTLFLDGVKVLENAPVESAWHKHFYKAAEGTEFEASYDFHISEMPNEDLFAVVECAHNLDSVKLNGVLMDKGNEESDYWLDKNFKKIRLSGLVPGRNYLNIKGVKINNITAIGNHSTVKDFMEHYPTEVDTVYIIGRFSVHNTDDQKSIFHHVMPDSHNLTRSGYPFYNGKAIFTTDIDMDNKTKYIKIDEVNAAGIKVFINGKEAGKAFMKPYIFNVNGLKQEGRNTITVEAYSTIANTFGPLHFAGIDKIDMVGPQTFVNMDRYTQTYQLFDFGIGALTTLEEDIE